MEKTDTHPTGKRFQYQDLLDGLEVPCPPADFRERETVAYRWVFDTMDDERNFLPQYVKNPKRFYLQHDTVKCKAIGLSLYATEDNARQRFEQLRAVMGDQAYEELGTGIAFGSLPKNTGVSGKSDSTGHFNFYPFAATEMQTHFEIIRKL